MKHHHHGLRVNDAIYLNESVRYLYPDFPPRYSDIDPKDLRGLIPYKINKVGKCGNSVTIVSPINGTSMGLSTHFVRKESML